MVSKNVIDSLSNSIFAARRANFVGDLRRRLEVKTFLSCVRLASSISASAYSLNKRCAFVSSELELNLYAVVKNIEHTRI